MTYYQDNAVCDYFVDDPPPNLIAIGWLDNEHDFPRGAVPEEFFVKLLQLLQDPWEPCLFMGVQMCELCQFPETANASFPGRGSAGGSIHNLFVPHHGKLFVAPELIAHYIDAHRYLPPPEFIDAVLACPEMKSMAYNKALLENGGRELMKRMDRESATPAADATEA